MRAALSSLSVRAVTPSVPSLLRRGSPGSSHNVTGEPYGAAASAAAAAATPTGNRRYGALGTGRTSPTSVRAAEAVEAAFGDDDDAADAGDGDPRPCYALFSFEVRRRAPATGPGHAKSGSVGEFLSTQATVTDDVRAQSAERRLLGGLADLQASRRDLRAVASVFAVHAEHEPDAAAGRGRARLFGAPHEPRRRLLGRWPSRPHWWAPAPNPCGAERVVLTPTQAAS